MPTLVQARKVNQTAASAANLSATFDVAPTAGNLLLAYVCSDSTILTPSGWTSRRAAVSEVGLYLFDKTSAGTETTVTVAPTTGTTSLTLVIEEWPACTPDQGTLTNTNATGTTAPTGTTATLASANDLAVAAFGVNLGGGAVTWNTYTNAYAEVAETTGVGTGNSIRIAVAQLNPTASTAAQSTTATLSASTGSFKGALIQTYTPTALVPDVTSFTYARMR